MAAFEEDTIVALASPPGRGAISCIRLSGNAANAAVNRLLNAGEKIESFPPRTTHLIWLFEQTGGRLDRVMVIRYAAPHSYTGEDLIEIFCHGGKWVPGKIIENLCQLGCRLAEPGEFTRRAFFNHKMDLIQAEAIEDIVSAESPAGLQNALDQLEGNFSQKMRELRQRLVHTCALLELGLDFSEEDVEFADRQQLAAELEGLSREIQFLLSGFHRGQALKDGWRVAIIGKPNVGKSSLMNALLRHDRVIVNTRPGTTRDTVEDSLLLDGHLFRLIDTAGIRASDDEIEAAGIARSRQAAEQAHILLFVSDLSQPADGQDEMIVGECVRLAGENEGQFQEARKIIHIRNKCDLAKSPQAFQLPFAAAMELETSALKGTGIAELENALGAATQSDEGGKNGEAIVTNLRHKQCLEKALAALTKAQQSLAAKLSAEFVATDLREVIHQIGALVGEVTPENILDEIFSHFCIGK